DSRERNRSQIGRTHTAFCDVLEADEEVRVIEFVDSDEAHERYGFDRVKRVSSRLLASASEASGSRDRTQ
ncbi:MAG: hypothetical protein V5A44_03605, partial [Haloarculaceae archaeon]